MRIKIHDTDEAQKAMEMFDIAPKYARQFRGQSLEAEICKNGVVRAISDVSQLNGYYIPAEAFTVETK